MDIELKQFIDNLHADISSMVYTDGEGALFEEKFAEYTFKILEDAGETEGVIPCAYIYPGEAGKDWKVSGYCLRDGFSEDSGPLFYETLDLFLVNYQAGYDYTFPKDQFTKGLNQVKRFLNGALKGTIDYLDPSLEIYELVNMLFKKGKKFDRVNIFYLINGTSNHKAEKIILKGFEDLGIFVHIWDINRFFQLSFSSGQREPVKIDFLDLLPEKAIGIQCLKIPDLNDLYECYLAILPGNVLSALYKEYSSKLLESNVRAFLGQKGKYNNAIKKTIMEKPQMFLPYNNGLSATADYVETRMSEGQMYITNLSDFQIVNGGQTTASLYHTEKTQKGVDLSSVYVQMKLTVIKDQVQKNIEVPFIARFANSQNKITDLDLSSNNQYLVRIEELSRRKYMVDSDKPNQPYLWFFERINGQYRENSGKLSDKLQKEFKIKNPPEKKFVKSDVSKFINLWDLEPHNVSLGAQKNFDLFVKKIDKLILKNKLPGENYYRKLIANAIIYKAMDKLFGRKNVDAIGDTNLKSFTVSYAVSYFHFLTTNHFDLWKVYEQQKLDPRVILLFSDLLLYVYNHMVIAANNSLLSEYAKKESSWSLLKEKSFDISKYGIDDLLISEELMAEREKEVEKSDEIENEIFAVSKIRLLGIRFWDGLKLYIAATKEFSDIEFDVWDIIKKIKDNKDLDSKCLKTGIKVLGFLEQQVIDVEVIRSESKLSDIEILDLKAVYDRLIELKREDWLNIIALAERTKNLDNLEIANLKSLSKMIINKEKIRESALIKGNESLEKMKKYKSR
jgi:hypothetical protein